MHCVFLLPMKFFQVCEMFSIPMLCLRNWYRCEHSKINSYFLFQWCFALNNKPIFLAHLFSVYLKCLWILLVLSYDLWQLNLVLEEECCLSYQVYGEKKYLVVSSLFIPEKRRFRILELRNRVMQYDVTLRVTNSKILQKFFFRVTNSTSWNIKLNFELRRFNFYFSTF